jgi:hypothetical protein
MSGSIDVDTAIAQADTEFPALFQLFGGYFNEDWREEYPTPAAAIAAFKVEAPRDAVRATAAELDTLLAAGLDDDALSRLLDLGFGSNYVPQRDGIGVSTWLAEVRDALR